jgi:hypothetical protein
MRANTLAVVVALAVVTVSIAPETGAQGAPAGAPNLKTVLFDVANSMGMLRFGDQRDAIRTLEVWGTGTMTVNGQPLKLTQYRASFNYHDHVRGVRVDYTHAGAGGKPQRRVEVVAGEFAWDEATPGMNATPAPATLRERLIRYYASPQALVKAAVAAGANTKVSQQAGNTVLTFPLPAPVADITATMELSTSKDMFLNWYEFAKRQGRPVPERLQPYPPLAGLVGVYPARVVLRDGASTIETTFAEYGDWNDDDLKADVFIPRRIVQRRGNVTTMDLTVTRTNTNSPYVIIPIPASVKAGGRTQ